MARVAGRRVTAVARTAPLCLRLLSRRSAAARCRPCLSVALGCIVVLWLGCAPFATHGLPATDAAAACNAARTQLRLHSRARRRATDAPLQFALHIGAQRATAQCVAGDGICAQAYQTLSVFFHTLGGRDWTNQTGWIEPGVSYCDYFGVTCDSNRHPESITLPRNNLNGNLSPRALNLSTLVALDVGVNFIEGPLPQLRQLVPRLQLLYAHCNGIRMPLPDMPDDLQHLYLGSNQLAGTLSAAALPSTLLTLRLGTNAINGSIPDELGTLEHLQVLHLHQNKLSGAIPTSLLSLTQLESLLLFDNSLVGSNAFVAGIPTLRNLKYLVLTGLELTGTLPLSWNMSSTLEVISLGGSDLDGTIPPKLLALPSLRVLQLSSNSFKGTLPPIPPDTGLVKLDLSYNLLSGAMYTSLPPSLHSVDLQWNKIGGLVTPQLLADLGRPTLRRFSMEINRVSCELPEPAAGSLDHFEPGHLELLAGNLFACPIPDDIEDTDPDGGNYVCGDSSLFTAAYTTGTCFFVFFVALAVHWLEHRDLSSVALPRHREVAALVAEAATKRYRGLLPEPRRLPAGPQTYGATSSAALLDHRPSNGGVKAGTVSGGSPSGTGSGASSTSTHNGSSIRSVSALQRAALARGGSARSDGHDGSSLTAGLSASGLRLRPEEPAVETAPLLAPRPVRGHTNGVRRTVYAPDALSAYHRLAGGAGAASNRHQHQHVDQFSDSASVVSQASMGSTRSEVQHHHELLKLAEAIDYQRSQRVVVGHSMGFLIVGALATAIYLIAPSYFQCIMYLTSTAVFVEGDSASPIVILMVVNLIILGAWYFRVRRTRFRLWRTRVGERTAVIRRLPKFVARDSQWRSCCVVALVFIQVFLVSTANVLYVLLEQRTNVTATRQLKKLAPVLLSMLKAGLTLFAVPWITKEVLVPLFSPTTYKAEHKTTFLFSMALTCVSSVVIPACSALLLDQRCLGSFFARPAGESVGITEHLCTAHGFLTRNCTGGKAFAASFVSAVDHPVRVDDTCPAAVLQLYGPIWVQTLIFTGVMAPAVNLLGDTRRGSRIVRPFQRCCMRAFRRHLTVGSERFMFDIVRGYVQMGLAVLLASSVGLLYPMVSAASFAAVVCKSVADERLLAVARSNGSLDVLSGARGVPTLGMLTAILGYAVILAMFAGFGTLGGIIVPIATQWLPLATVGMLLGLEYVVRRWWRHQPLPIDSEALHGTPHLKKRLSQFGRAILASRRGSFNATRRLPPLEHRNADDDDRDDIGSYVGDGHTAAAGLDPLGVARGSRSNSEVLGLLEAAEQRAAAGARDDGRFGASGGVVGVARPDPPGHGT